MHVISIEDKTGIGCLNNKIYSRTGCGLIDWLNRGRFGRSRVVVVVVGLLHIRL